MVRIGEAATESSMIRKDIYHPYHIFYAVCTYTMHARLRGKFHKNWWFGRVSDRLTNDIVPRSQRHAGILPQWQASPRSRLARTLASGIELSSEE